MGASPAAAGVMLAVVGALAAGCARPPPLADAQVQALAREGAYLAGEVKQLRRDAVLEEGRLATAVGASRHGELVAFSTLDGDDATLTAIDRTGSPRRLWSLELNAGRREVEAVEVAPDGSMVATAGRDGFVRTFRGRTGVPGAALGLRQPLVSLALRADGARLAVGTAQGRVVVTTFPGLEVVASAELHGGQEVRGLAYRADGAIVSGGWDRSVVISQPDGGDLREARRKILPQFINDLQVGGGVAAVALSPAPLERIPAGGPTSVDPDEDSAVALLDAATLEEVLRPVRHRGPVSTAAMAPDGLVFLSGGWDGSVFLEQRDAPPERAPLEAPFRWVVRRVRLTRDGRYALIAAWAPPPAEKERPAPSVVVEELVRRTPEVVRDAPVQRP